MKKTELKKILHEHLLYLNDAAGGVRADLRYANLREANLRGADLRYAVLRGADLRYAVLREADLRYANLREANLRGANLRGADLKHAFLPEYLITPAGTIVGYKKIHDRIITLEIPSDACRMNPLVSRKCRAEFAKVIAIDGDTTPKLSITGGHDPGFTYTVGEIVRPDSYDDNIRIECTHGIHFFITEKEAMEY